LPQRAFSLRLCGSRPGFRAGRAKKTLHVFDTLQVLALLFSTPARKASLEPLSRRGRTAEKRVKKLQGSNWFWFSAEPAEECTIMRNFSFSFSGVD
jgi:hypothetical protein